MKKELNMREIQDAALSVLIKFDEICTKHGFKYFLMYGTLIGAVRHNGFIPWDDDIDVMMPRKDFNRFMKYAEKNKEQLYPFMLHNRKNTENYWYGIPRFSDMRYKYIITDSFEKSFDIGVFIDIYPLDSFGNTQQEADKIFHDCKLISRKYDWYVNSRSQGNGLRSVVKTLGHLYMRIKKGRNYHLRIESEIDRYIMDHTDDNSKYLGLITWATKEVLFERSIIGEVECIRHPFSSYEFMIPKEYDYMLRKIYGDYMKLPPEEERIPTHNYKIIVR